MPKSSRKLSWALASAVSLISIAFAISACNVFDPLDSPTSDPQLLSAARACFDQGDMTCAKELYGKLSANEADIASSELAFAVLDENGVNIASFAEAVSSGGGGSGLTKFAGKLSTHTPGVDKRLALYGAYLKVVTIKDTSLRGFVRFAVGLALAAEILSEDSRISGTFGKSDLVTTPASCSNNATCVANAACAAPSGSKIIVGSTTFDFIESSTNTLPAATALSGSPTLQMFNSFIKAVYYGLTTELKVSGSFSSGAAAFSNVISNTNPATSESCYRAILLSQGVGA